MQAAYVCYNKCDIYHSFEFNHCILGQLKYADCLLMLGQLGASYARVKNVFNRCLLIEDRMCESRIS